MPAGFSHTNNGVEAFNSAIKVKYSNWERFRFEEFINVLKEIILDYSQKTLHTPFTSTFTINENLWQRTAAMIDDSFLQEGDVFYWAKLNKNKARKKIAKAMFRSFQNVKRCRTLSALKKD